MASDSSEKEKDPEIFCASAKHHRLMGHYKAWGGNQIQEVLEVPKMIMLMKKKEWQIPRRQNNNDFFKSMIPG